MKKILLALTPVLLLSGCASGLMDADSNSVYSEAELNQVNDVNDSIKFETMDQVFESDALKDDTVTVNTILSENGFTPLNVDDLKSKGVDLSALNEPTIHFQYDSYALSNEARMVINAHAKLLEEVPNLKVILEGHTDKIGDRTYNLKLGEKRALAVKEYIETLGVDTSKVEVISYGEEKLLNLGDSDEDNAGNRRAEFVYE